MIEEWKARGELLQELDTLRSRISQVERKKIDGGLKEIGQGFRRILDNFTEGVLFIDLETKRLVTGNKIICQMLGYDVESFVSLEIRSICHPEDPNHLIEQFEKQAEGELVFRKDVPFRRKDGDLFYADVIMVPLTVSGKRYVISFLRKTLARKIESVLQQNISFDFQKDQRLTKIEIKILRLIVEGKSNKEIAEVFHRSRRTIENHRAHLMKKLGVDNSIGLVKRAVAMKLVDLQEDQGPGNTT